MPSSNAPLEERLRKLEREMAFVRSQGLSPDEHDRLLEDKSAQGEATGGGGSFLLTVNLILTLGVIAYLVWTEMSVEPKVEEQPHHGSEVEELPKEEPLPFILPSRKTSSED